MRAKQVLEGIRIADFSWVGVGPISTKLLGDHGAVVVRVESTTHPDIMRKYIPYAGGIPGINRSGFFAQYNTSKYGITLNLKHQRGIEVAKRLVAWADVTIESFVPGTMERFGLGYEELRKLKPNIIMVRATLQGQTGPHSKQPGFGSNMIALAGFVHLIGYTGPIGTTCPYTDFISPWYIVTAILGALDYRRRTGKGQSIDLSQLEAGVSFLSPALLDAEVNQRVKNPKGNRCPYAAPHGVYRCQGEDRWCAIAVFSDEEWQGFCKIMGKPEWIQDTRFATLMNRKKNEDELDRLLEEWTLSHTAEEVMERMQSIGVPSGVVKNGHDLSVDPQFDHRHHFFRLRHPEMGIAVSEMASFRFSKTPADPEMAAPCMGEHNEYICTKLLNMKDEEFVEFLADGAFE